MLREWRNRNRHKGTLTKVLDVVLRRAKAEAKVNPILFPDITKINRIENTKLGSRTVFWFGGLHKNSTYQISIVSEFDPRQIYEVYTGEDSEVILGKIVHLVKKQQRIIK
jgi:hypothetical protein